jgi:hypothetical protein
MSDQMKFTSANGRGMPRKQARRYVYNVLTMMLDYELTDREGWMFGGIDNECDRRRLKTAIRAVIREMTKKAKKGYSSSMSDESPSSSSSSEASSSSPPSLPIEPTI